ncbi:MAG TPA: hypothetical protein ENF70_04800 [Deltaproteobacteria bacterium]|nr:hypothetical protein [Deltaproteobacteria bacterium]
MMMKYNFLKMNPFPLLAVIMISSLLIYIPICLAGGKIYGIAYDYAYKAGYAGGKDEKAKGYDYEPEVVLAQPFFQMLLKAMKQKLNLSGSQEEEWDQGFRDGFNAGFKDGYYGYPKKPTRFD